MKTRVSHRREVWNWPWSSPRTSSFGATTPRRSGRRRKKTATDYDPPITIRRIRRRRDPTPTSFPCGAKPRTRKGSARGGGARRSSSVTSRPRWIRFRKRTRRVRPVRNPIARSPPPKQSPPPRPRASRFRRTPPPPTTTPRNNTNPTRLSAARAAWVSGASRCAARAVPSVSTTTALALPDAAGVGGAGAARGARDPPRRDPRRARANGGARARQRGRNSNSAGLSPRASVPAGRAVPAAVRVGGSGT